MAKKKDTSEVTDILRVETGVLECYIVGTSPLIMNRLSQKAKQELLLPKGKKSAFEKATSLKHMPVDEYRASVHRLTDGPTLLAMPSTAFKGSLRTAALDMPGAKKAVIGRLTYISGEFVQIFGVPKLFMRPVRSADMNRTPDIRTRAILREWACRLEVTYVQPLLRAQAVANLLASAGITIGVGDWRTEKGSGSFGQFRLVDKTDADFKRIVKEGTRAQQTEALANPVCYDEESQELYDWFLEEHARRMLKGVA